MGEGHPECPDGLRAIERVLEGEEFQTLLRERAPRGSSEVVLRVHPGDFYETLERESPASGYARLDADTVMSPFTFEAALHAAGGACLAVDEVMSARCDNAFVAMRPPGHHAERATAMGFCFFNNAAIAAR